jgi:hypothetical protein
VGVALLTVEQAEPREQLVAVLAASQHVPQGTFFKEPQLWFEIKALPRKIVPKNAAMRFDQIKDKVARKSFAQGSAADLEDILHRDMWTRPHLPNVRRALTFEVSHADCLGCNRDRASMS